MSIFKQPSIEIQPNITLYRWGIFKVKSKLWDEETYHFVGDDGYGRTSSKIVKFDKENLIGITESGRIYKLVKNHKGLNLDAGYVFGRYCDINEIYEKVEVNPEDVILDQ